MDDLATADGAGAPANGPLFAAKAVRGMRYSMEDRWAAVPELVALPACWGPDYHKDRLPATPSCTPQAEDGSPDLSCSPLEPILRSPSFSAFGSAASPSSAAAVFEDVLAAMNNSGAGVDTL